MQLIHNSESVEPHCEGILAPGIQGCNAVDDPGEFSVERAIAGKRQPRLEQVARGHGQHA
jgi:hypothetical protein